MKNKNLRQELLQKHSLETKTAVERLREDLKFQKFLAKQDCLTIINQTIVQQDNQSAVYTSLNQSSQAKLPKNKRSYSINHDGSFLNQFA